MCVMRFPPHLGNAWVAGANNFHGACERWLIFRREFLPWTRRRDDASYADGKFGKTHARGNNVR